MVIHYGYTMQAVQLQTQLQNGVVQYQRLQQVILQMQAQQVQAQSPQQSSSPTTSRAQQPTAQTTPVASKPQEPQTTVSTRVQSYRDYNIDNNNLSMKQVSDFLHTSTIVATLYTPHELV